MKTLAAWIQAHPGINVLAFERNHYKSFGFGENEEVCGFCLASHYFIQALPESCKFCRSPLRETYVISDLPEIINRTYSSRLHSSVADLKVGRALLFIVQPKDADGRT